MTNHGELSRRSLFRAALDLARAGNFPSVASNVLAALVLSASAGPANAFPAPGLLALTILAGCLVYAGGATLNDVFDAAFDRARRPERAIPRGLISRAGAAWLGSIEMALGLAVLIIFTGASVAWAAALAACILAYDWLHKRWIGSVVLMAGCRVLLALTIATLPGHGFTSSLLGWVGALFVYIVTLSLIARWEYAPGAPAAKIGRSVGRLLAFIPLIDAVALLLVGAWVPALACAAAVPLGRWAQRLAAST
ncbi:MAG: UbiA family prenyltransferase [Opitutaceae bacterium]|nr:UbiA family prenyltransferase [Opitutaceae bacterium]